MPTSSNITMPYVSTIMQSLHPKTALDIGIGMGKYGFLFREACEWIGVFESGISCVKKENWNSRLDGVEVCSDYITPLQRYLYDEIFIGLAEEVVPKLGQYDLIFLGDVIEHFEKSQGQKLLDILFEISRIGVLIVTPIGEYQQSGSEQNTYEEHKSVWSPADLRRFNYVWARKVFKRQWVMLVSRNKLCLPDPLAVQKSYARRQRLKKLVKLLFGKKGLDLLLKIKRYHKGRRE